jgi:hypothetical protein
MIKHEIKGVKKQNKGVRAHVWDYLLLWTKTGHSYIN